MKTWIIGIVSLGLILGVFSVTTVVAQNVPAYCSQYGPDDTLPDECISQNAGGNGSGSVPAYCSSYGPNDTLPPECMPGAYGYTVKDCAYASYNTSEWNTNGCANKHLQVCQYLYKTSGSSNVKVFVNSDAGQSFHCYDYSDVQIAPSGAGGGGAGGPSGSGTSTSQTQCNNLTFLSSAWYFAGCRNIQTAQVKQYCVTHDYRDPNWNSLNCREFTNNPWVIGGGSPNGGSGYPGAPVPVPGSTVVTGSTTSTGVSCSAKFKSLVDVLGWIRCLAGIIIPLGLSIAFIVFMGNVIRYVIAPNPTKDNERRKYIVGAMIGLFVLVAVWGIVAFVTNTFGLGFVVPQLPK